ncbi:hypothetical protein BDC45DRAFT_570739 [Circinella umbellata]|nr:hypothetical protein BDC45DRAFT_570739 [Circinella umbellata]
MSNSNVEKSLIEENERGVGQTIPTLSQKQAAQLQLYKDTLSSFLDSTLVMKKFISAARQDGEDLLVVTKIRSKGRLNDRVNSSTIMTPQASTSLSSSPSSSTSVPPPPKRLKMASDEMLSMLIKEVGSETVVDLDKITKKFKELLYKYTKKLLNRHKLVLPYAVTIGEHDILTSLARGKDLDDIENVRDNLFLMPVTLYENKHLTFPLHKEAFYQAHVYAQMVDGILLHDFDFRIIRFE